MQYRHAGTDPPTNPQSDPAAGETDLDRTFAAIYARIEAHPADPDLDKDAAVEAVREIEREAARGEDADPQTVEQWLRSLAFIAPDVLAITMTGLVGSDAGIGAVIREIAERTKENPDAG
jgi:hypothetical protein